MSDLSFLSGQLLFNAPCPCTERPRCWGMTANRGLHPRSSCKGQPRSHHPRPSPQHQYHLRRRHQYHHLNHRQPHLACRLYVARLLPPISQHPSPSRSQFSTKPPPCDRPLSLLWIWPRTDVHSGICDVDSVAESTSGVLSCSEDENEVGDSMMGSSSGWTGDGEDFASVLASCSRVETNVRSSSFGLNEGKRVLSAF